MTDWRYQGHGMRRRMGAPSSHLEAANQAVHAPEHEPYALPGTEHLYERPKQPTWAAPN